MNISKRQAARRLGRLHVELGGGLLRSLGAKQMPGRVQATKYEISMTALREAMRPDDAQRDLENLELEVTLLRQQIETIRRAVRPILQPRSEANGGRERHDVNAGC